MNRQPKSGNGRGDDEGRGQGGAEGMGAGSADERPSGSALPEAQTSGAATPMGQVSAVGVLLRQARLAAGLTLGELCRKIGCTRSYLSMVETGARSGQLSDEFVMLAERALGLNGELERAVKLAATPSEVREEIDRMQREQQRAAAELREVLGALGASGKGLDAAYRSGALESLVARLEGSAGNIDLGSVRGREALVRQVPLVNKVAAGYPREFTDLGYPGRVADEYVSSPAVEDPDAFAARVVGDSMTPEYREGDIVVFSPNKAVKSGMDCFVRLEKDNETTFKRVEFLEGGQVRLIALNAKYAPRVYAREDVAFVCPAVSVTREVR